MYKKIVIFMLLLTSIATLAEEFPGRKKYYNVKVIELETLERNFDN